MNGVALTPENGLRAAAVGRLTWGLIQTLAPTTVRQLLFLSSPDEDQTLTVLRMKGGRDVAMGLGALLGARRGGVSSLRGWSEAGALVDVVDALVTATGAGVLRPGVRVGGTLVGAGLAGASIAFARAVTDDTG